jgi:hypothetical protein
MINIKYNYTIIKQNKLNKTKFLNFLLVIFNRIVAILLYFNQNYI